MGCAVHAESPPGVNTPALLQQRPISGTKATLTVPSAQLTLIKGQLVSPGEEGKKGAQGSRSADLARIAPAGPPTGRASSRSVGTWKLPWHPCQSYGM